MLVAYSASLRSLHSNNSDQIIQIEVFTSVAEDSNSGLTTTNPASGQSRTGTRDRRIASLTRWPLGHAGSTGKQTCFASFWIWIHIWHQHWITLTLLIEQPRVMRIWNMSQLYRNSHLQILTIYKKRVNPRLSRSFNHPSLWLLSKVVSPKKHFTFASLDTLALCITTEYWLTLVLFPAFSDLEAKLAVNLHY